MPELVDATLDCTECTRTWSAGHGAISCPCCAVGHVLFEKNYEVRGDIEDAILKCTHCSNKWNEGYGAILSLCCQAKDARCCGFVKLQKIRKHPHFSHATLSCTHCPQTWNEGVGAIPCPSCCRGHVHFQTTSKDASLTCTRCSKSWSEGHGEIKCPCCETGFVKFVKHLQDGPLQDATLKCTACGRTFNEGAGAIKSPCCNDGFVHFEKVSAARRVVDATLACTFCGVTWHEGHGSIPCPFCPAGHVRFTKIFRDQIATARTSFTPNPCGRQPLAQPIIRKTFSGKIINPWELHYTQDSIKRSFQCGRALCTTIQELRSDPDAAFAKIPMIQVFEKGGKTWTADNRRLYCFREANLTCVPVRWITADAVDPRKFTSLNSGTSIRMR